MDVDRDQTLARRVRAFVSHSPERTETLGEDLGKRLERGAVIALNGELGAGKTCFVRGLARGLGVADTVTSPTYALLQSYSGRLELYHFDAWMEGRERALLMDGGTEWLTSDGVAVVEWGERVSEFLPEPRLEIRFGHAGAAARRIEIYVVGRGEASRALERLVAGLATGNGLEEIAH